NDDLAGSEVRRPPDYLPFLSSGSSSRADTITSVRASPAFDVVFTPSAATALPEGTLTLVMRVADVNDVARTGLPSSSLPSTGASAGRWARLSVRSRSSRMTLAGEMRGVTRNVIPRSRYMIDLLATPRAVTVTPVTNALLSPTRTEAGCPAKVVTWTVFS